MDEQTRTSPIPVDKSYGTTQNVEDDGSSLSSDDGQQGVKGIEAISSSWTKTSLIWAYVGIFLLAIATSMESQTTTNLTIYATSAFSAHSLVSTVLVVQSIVNAVIKPPMAKIANVFGRLEAFTIGVAIYVIGYIQMAASNNVETFASAQIFYSAGSQGLQVLQQIFIADTSDLLNRALFSSLPDIPFIATVWAGPPAADNLVTHTTWRWGYGIWTIILPAAFLPLALALLFNVRKAKKMQLLPPSPWQGQTIGGALKRLWYDLDVMGLLLLSAAFTLLLVPLTLAAKASSKWKNPSLIAMMVVGGICLLLFPLWESIHKLAPRPFLSLRLLTNRTVLVGCTIAFFYFAVFYTSIQPYFSSYLQVVHNQSITAAGHIVNTFTFSSTISSVLISLAIKYTRHYKYYVTAGACIYLLAVGLIIRYRSSQSSIGQMIGTQIALGIGGGMINVPAQLGVQASVAHSDVAAATAVFLTVLEIGGAVGSAISGAIWSNNVLSKLEAYLPPAAQANASLIFGNISIAQSYAAGSPEKIAVDRSYQESLDLILIVAACFAAPLIPLSLLMKNYRLDAVDQHVKGEVIGHDQARSGSVQDHEELGSGDTKKRGWLARLKR